MLFLKFRIVLFDSFFFVFVYFIALKPVVVVDAQTRRRQEAIAAHRSLWSLH